MLPSTGYFKTINCPFFESGFCERPYCHFRHVKRDHSATSSASKDVILSDSTTKQQNAETAYPQKTSGLEVSLSPSAQVVSVSDVEMSYTQKKAPPQAPKATYNPTPIAELNKMHANSEKDDEDDDTEQKRKHIPVPYTPRKPNTLPVKRPLDTNGACKPFIFNPPPVKYTPGVTENVQVDIYTPKGSTESQHKYLPGTETQLQEYTPNTNDAQSAAKHNYVPSDKSVNKKKVLEYKPMKVTTKPNGPTYKPTPKELVPCFSSDEDEPEVKKQKFDNDLNGMDDFASEFDMLGEILKEEIPQQDISEQSVDLQNNDNKEESVSEKVDESNKKSLKKHEHSKKSKSLSNRHNDKKTHEKDKSDKKEKHSSSSSKADRSEKKSKNLKDSSNKSHSTSSSKDKHKTDKYNKSAEKKKSSSSKSSDKTSKHSENGSSRHSDKHTKHSSSRSHSSSKDKKKGDHHRSSKESKDSRERKKHKVKETKNLFNDNNVHDDMPNNDDDDYTEMSDLDEEAIALECKKIFDEYVPTEKALSSVEDSANNQINQVVESDVDEYVPVKKRISRTVEKNVKVIPRAPLKPDYKISAAQAMASRLEKVREFHAARISVDMSNSNIHSVKPEPPKTCITTPIVTSSKIRIAHVPYASTLLNAKKTIAPSTKAKPDEPSTSSTIAHTVPKGVQRVARIPNEKFIDRPGVLEPLASKIPANVRSTYLNMMIDECLKIYLLPIDAYARAQHEELATSKKCCTVQIYKNSAVLTVSRLRKELQECNGVKKYGSDCTALQNMPQGAISDNTGSWSIVNKTRKSSDTSQEFHGAKFYNNIKKWILTEDQLVENGFPRPHPSGEKGRAIIHGQNKLPPPKGLGRTCCRCKKDYTVDKKGFPVGNEECIYHPKNKYRVRGEVKYQCCSQDNSSDGCCVASCHVYEYVDYDNLKGYIRTMPPSSTMNDYGVYSLDCEMCYTTHGLDLTRITVINSSCKVVYETLIKPLHPIIDYNTRYSGITEDQMASVKTTLLEVQATLLAMFNSKTILVGHSLESDFKALKLIHDTVIDTSVLFPHKMGPPFKRALRNLSSEYLRKIIQNAVEGGHDSAEDATVCMELLVYKLKEDLKTR